MISSKFECVDKGPLQMFLGMQIQRDGDTGDISMNQSAYIDDMLQRHGMHQCRTTTTPLDAGYQVACNEKTCEQVDATAYQSAIGELMWLALTSRPDIYHSVVKLAQRNNNPHTEHLTGVKYVMRYLAATKDLKLNYHGCGQALGGYVDADWGGDMSNRRSYTGYAFFLAGGPISWKSEKQNSVALSSTEAEYMALSSAAKEA
uniref:Retrovirus-related Pol polyprotein from transposon TNT 1-94 n=1 Tax=Bactrocera latifrons TaxID=174628 RepID=A0A0K8VG31_BACLA